MDRGQRDTGQLDPTRAFEGLLAQHPDAHVAALGDDGLLVPMPASVPLDRHRVVVGRSVLDMVVPADKITVISTWDRSRDEGGAQAIVHLLTDPDRAVTVTLVDARRDHGVHLAMLVATNDVHRGGPGPGLGAASVTVVPRTARVRKNERAVVTEIDDATTLILGWERDELVGRRSLDFIHPDDQERSISNWMEMLTAPGHDQRVRLRHLRSDGTWVWMEITNRNLLEVDDQRCVVTEMLDISEELAAQEALRASEQLLRRLAESLPLGVIHLESDRSISYANERASAITGAPHSAVFTEQFRSVVAADEEAVRAALDTVLELGVDQDIQVRIDLGARAGVRLCTVGMRALTSGSGAVTGAIVCMSDVTDQVRMQDELERRATYDALTGCLNRQSVISFLDDRMAEPGTGVGIIFVDLDGFKQVNDSLGHAAGDDVLVGVGALLRDAVRPGDVVGRVGGDEFLVVCTGLPSIDEALAVAERIDAAFETGIEVGDVSLAVRASLGVAHTMSGSWSSDRLVAEADTAMYCAKRERRPAAPMQPASRPTTLRTRASEQEVALRRAIDHGELEVHFQPIVSIPSRAITALEALVRWRRGGELIPAVAFIDLAERSGLIVDVGEWVVDEVCRSAASLDLDGETLRWGINLSPRELARPAAASMVLAALERHHVPADRIVIEVTEHANLGESPTAMQTVHQLAELGATIALDDFGTGYSSLALLRSLPVACIKLDRSFTADIGVDPAAGHVLDLCGDLARRLGLVMVVEGVETEAQAEHLVRSGVDYAQGYLFSAARPLDELRSQIGTGCAITPP